MTARIWAIAISASGAVHAACALAAPAPAAPARPAEPTIVTFDEIPVAESEPQPEPEPPVPVPTPDVAPAMKQPTAARAAPTPASAPMVAAAGRTLTTDAAAPGEVADFTLAQGAATAYAGGTTAATGTGTAPGRDTGSTAPAAASNTAAPAAPAPPKPDLSRAASPDGADWSCSHLFPSDADAPDSAAVRVVVGVGADGVASGVTVLSDPGHGFGAAARRCALGQRFQPARGADGAPVAGRTPPFIVRFKR